MTPAAIISLVKCGLVRDGHVIFTLILVEEVAILCFRESPLSPDPVKAVKATMV